MDNAIERKLWEGAALAELGTLAAYSQDILDTHTTALITMGLGASIFGVYAIDSAHEILKKVAKNTNEIYRTLING